jgi:WD40 repeat protein
LFAISTKNCYLDVAICKRNDILYKNIFVQIWDLTAGKVLTTMNLHSGPVNVVQFHPKELLLGTGSSDKYVYLYYVKSSI